MVSGLPSGQQSVSVSMNVSVSVLQPTHLGPCFNFLAQQLDQRLVVVAWQHGLISKPHLQLQGAQVAPEMDGAQNQRLERSHTCQDLRGHPSNCGVQKPPRRASSYSTSPFGRAGTEIQMQKYGSLQPREPQGRWGQHCLGGRAPPTGSPAELGVLCIPWYENVTG